MSTVTSGADRVRPAPPLGSGRAGDGGPVGAVVAITLGVMFAGQATGSGVDGWVAAALESPRQPPRRHTPLAVVQSLSDPIPPALLVLLLVACCLLCGRRRLGARFVSIWPRMLPRFRRPARRGMGTQLLLITPFVGVVEAWLRADLRIKGTVVHERLVAEYGFTGHYQRVKMFLAEAKPRIAAELAERDENPLSGLHRRFEVVPSAQAQVDWGDEGELLAHVGIPNVYSFHMVLSYSRDPFCCFTTSMDLATFWDCHRRAFAHFCGVPGARSSTTRTKTVIRRHVAPGVAVPLHPEAAGPPTITVSPSMCWPRIGRPGRVGWNDRSTIVRDHVLARLSVLRQGPHRPHAYHGATFHDLPLVRNSRPSQSRKHLARTSTFIRQARKTRPKSGETVG